MELCDFERDVIRLVAGLPQESITSWGAGLGAALESLNCGGYLYWVNGEYKATEKGL